MCQRARQSELIAVGLCEAGVGPGSRAIPLFISNVGLVPAVDGSGCRELDFGRTLRADGGAWIAYGGTSAERHEGIARSSEVRLAHGVELPAQDGSYGLIATATTEGNINRILIYRVIPAGQPVPSRKDVERQLAEVAA